MSLIRLLFYTAALCSFSFILYCEARSPEFVTPGNCSDLKFAYHNNFAKTHWTPRPTGQQLGIYTGVGVCDKINLPNNNDFYMVADVMVLAERNWKASNSSSFFADPSGVITFGVGTGMKMVNANSVNPPTNQIVYAPGFNDTADIRAADFGLATSLYNGTFCFEPTITNLVANMDFFFGLDNLIQGLYIRARAPVTYSRWNLNAHVGGQNSQQQALVQGFIEPISNNFPTNTIYQATTSLSDGGVALEGQEFVGLIPLLEYGYVTGAQSTTGLADMPIDLGLNFLLTDRARFGISLHVVLPFGTHDDDPALFSPRIGLGRWQVGADMGAYYHFWENDFDKFSIYAEFCPCALLSCDEMRMLGLQVGGTTAFNHYLLLKKIRPAGLTQQITTCDVNGTKIITLERAANLLYQRVRLATIANIDGAVWLRYQRGHLETIVGWNISARGAETIANPEDFIGNGQMPRDAQFGDGSSLYLIKGDTPMWVPVVNTPPTTFICQAPSPHGYDKVNSNIHALGTLLPLGSTAPAQNQATNPPTAISIQVLNQLQQASITADDVSAAPALHGQAISTAFFVWLGHNFIAGEVDAFCGAGFQAEFGLHNTAMNFATFFIKGGFSF